MNGDTVVKVTVVQECYDAKQSHRVLLRYIGDPNDEHQGMDFFSISLEKLVDETWKLLRWISEPSFRDNAGNQMWVVEVHEFSVITGIARIKVGELHPTPSGGASAEYSWRDWDLFDNVQMQMIKICSSFEPFDGYQD